MEHQHRRRGVGPGGLPVRNVYNLLVSLVSFGEGSNFIIMLLCLPTVILLLCLLTYSAFFQGMLIVQSRK